MLKKYQHFYQLEAERLASIALEQAENVKEKVVVLEISIYFYSQQMHDDTVVGLGLQALHVRLTLLVIRLYLFFLRTSVAN